MAQKFAKAVLTRRKQLGLTQDELAKRVGTTKQMVSKYELGQRSPKVQMANAFAEALETTLDQLLDIEKESPTPVLKESTDPDTQTVSELMEALHQNPKLGVLFDRQLRMSEDDIDIMLQITNRILKENYGD